jgi:hypothetical protein
MSSLHLGALTMGMINPFQVSTDRSHCDSLYHGKGSRAPDEFLFATEVRGVSDNAPDAYFYATRWWPRSGQIMGGWGNGLTGDLFQSKSPRWKSPFTTRGANGRLGYVGYTRDQYGSVLGGCTVRLIRVSTDELVAKVVSDANGLYFATTPYNDAHVRVTHNAAGNLGGASNLTDLPG